MSSRSLRWMVGVVGLLVVNMVYQVDHRPNADTNSTATGGTTKTCPTTVEQRLVKADLVMSGDVLTVLSGGVLGARVIITPQKV